MQLISDFLPTVTHVGRLELIAPEEQTIICSPYCSSRNEQEIALIDCSLP